ncbi:cysteine proteinase [Fistulina hepatica ATCC 64428]|uniref:ubiquitinyl hydrolase 1 n=1 Tax=Fistulina hepatica ATCC 64428 TaxID=1128425 RepID=A0A0D7APZ7_9AGAR|nr:cysteine proteinase [Fistulina hepatica ATCC 64428]
MNSLPSPSSSSDNSTPTNSRKRQRSQSMQSDASSSSTKRPQPQPPAVDEDIDAYMATQPDQDTPMFAVPLDRFKTVQSLKQQPMQPGQTWYLVAAEWLKRWTRATSGEIDKEGPLSEDELGPVDNASLLDSLGNLNADAVEGIDMDYVPEDVWKRFVEWYGPPTHVLQRKVILRAAHPVLELYPPRVCAMQLTTVPNPQSGDPAHLSVSAAASTKDLVSQLAQALVPDAAGPYRAWRVNVEARARFFPVASLTPSDGRLIIESDTRTAEEEGVMENDVFVVEFQKKSGKWLVSDDVEPGEVQEEKPLFGDAGFFESKKFDNRNTPSRYGPEEPPKKSFSPSLARTTPSREPGTVGLGNMGNTCFMNSALQCLVHTPELMEYFLSGVFTEELNPDNPLGMHGAIAQAFAVLVERLWSTDGGSTSSYTSSSSYTPRDFKMQLQRFAPQFSGYQQHDSQELVAFLLDGLHEDLNRVLKKPYVEKPDWEGGSVGQQLLDLASRSWEGYMKRNDSVIVDLFQGQYMSTLVCPECDKVSITFDPFMYLTLPLPISKKWTHDIYYVPWDLEKPHLKVPIEINNSASFRDVRALLGRWMDAPPENLLTMEVFSSKFWKYMDDHQICSEVQPNDIIVCFELPCLSPQSRRYLEQPLPFVLPVFLGNAPAPARLNNSARSAKDDFGYPFIVAIDYKQAKSLDGIYRAVAERLQRWTRHARDLFSWEAPTPGYDTPVVPLIHSGKDSIVEITAQDGVMSVTEQQVIPDEGDIVDETAAIFDDAPVVDGVNCRSSSPIKLGPKHDVFAIRLQMKLKEMGATSSSHSLPSSDFGWTKRLSFLADPTRPPLLHHDDGLICEFDENMKDYYFGSEANKWETALWDKWPEFVHPELEAARLAELGQSNRSVITLQDCLDEFTKEEQLGEDDLWYCPRCKKHQQATKSFDLWSTPDILVVHLKRFSNSRVLRDKIDAFVDFPIEDLDLGDMVGERKVRKNNGLEGEDDDEPLVYDLFGVDEHIGGLGGGHYRAYVLNHVTGKWYHFDDSFVTPAKATEAVNPNAYLLFYRRRTATHLGGKSYKKILEAKMRRQIQQMRMEAEQARELNNSMTLDSHQLPTPPSEPEYTQRAPMVTVESSPWQPDSSNLDENNYAPLEDTIDPLNPDAFPSLESDPPSFSEAQYDPVLMASHRFNFPDPSESSNGLSSPTSSNEASRDPDSDDEVWSSDNMQFSSHHTPSGSNSPAYTENSSPNPPIAKAGDAGQLEDISDLLDLETLGGDTGHGR